jgi:hypothetical protein
VYEMVKGRKFDRLSEMVTEADCYGMWGQKWGTGKQIATRRRRKKENQYNNC